MITDFSALETAVRALPPVGTAVAAAADPEVIDSLAVAMKDGWLGPCHLTGDPDALRQAVLDAGADPADFVLVPAGDDAAAAAAAVALVRDGHAGVLVKGSLKSSLYLKAILDKENGIRRGSVLSNISVFQMPSYHKLLALTDNAVLVLPGLEEKKQLLINSLPLWEALGVRAPKVALLAAVETVSGKMPATTDAAALMDWHRAGGVPEFILDGPLGYDAAISREAAVIKGLGDSPVAGDCDLLLCPNLETANSLGKSYKFHGGATWGGLVFGASVPAVLNSRSDDRRNRLHSLLLARAVAAVA